MDKNVRIRRADQSDIPLLAAMGKKTFYEAFAEHNSKENMDLFLETQFTHPVLASEMEEEGAAFFLAYLEDLPVGFSKVRTGHEPKDLFDGLVLDPTSQTGALEIERIYILGDYQDQKIGSALIDHHIAIARERACELIWLGVWEKNVSAIRFYERWGFHIFGGHHFILGKDIQTDILMRRRL